MPSVVFGLLCLVAAICGGIVSIGLLNFLKPVAHHFGDPLLGFFVLAMGVVAPVVVLSAIRAHPSSNYEIPIAEPQLAGGGSDNDSSVLSGDNVTGLILLGLLIVIASIGGVFLYYKITSDREDASRELIDWQAATHEGSVQRYQGFVRMWPRSVYVAEANRKITLLNKEDNAQWGEAKDVGLMAGYRAYLNKFPSGLHAEEAEHAINALGKTRALSIHEERSLKQGDRFQECQECPVMVVVPPGAFVMGSSGDAIEKRKADQNEGPAHTVRIAYALAVGRFETTFGEWDACVASGGCRGYKAGDEGWGRDNRPVFNVSWDDAKLYVKWLSNKTGKRYRLLSEAEWEYAARAGSTTTSYFFGSDPRGLCKYANIADESARGDIQPHGYGSWIMCNDGYFRTAPVGRFAPNQFGLYDMLGNVSEWVEDVWHGSYEGAPSDGTAWLVGGDPGYRIARGGNFFDVDYGVRLEFRANHPAGTLGSLIGFRVARELEQ